MRFVRALAAFVRAKPPFVQTGAAARGPLATV